jgi:hypothetical protein
MLNFLREGQSLAEISSQALRKVFDPLLEGADIAILDKRDCIYLEQQVATLKEQHIIDLLGSIAEIIRYTQLVVVVS